MQIPDLKHPRSVAIGQSHICAITDDGVKCWGDNNWAQLDVPPLKNPTRLTTSGLYTCAETDDGMKCWGLIPQKYYNPKI
jgi:alpha-tubulin suppressor-like RCC1 family protein